MALKIVNFSSSEAKISGEDWDCLMCQNGKLFTSDSSPVFKVWSSQLKLVKEVAAHEYPICDMKAGQGSTFFTSSSDSTIKYWDEENGEFILLDTFEGHQEPVRKLRFDGESGRLFSGDDIGQVLIWEKGKLLGALETLEEIWDMAVYKDTLGTVRHWDIVLHNVTKKEDKIRHSIKNIVPGKGPLVIIEPSGKFVHVDRSDFSIHVRDVTKPNWPEVAKLEGHNAVINGMKADSKRNILYSVGADSKIMAWDLETCQQKSVLLLEGPANDIALDEESGLIFIGGQNKFLNALSLS